MRAEATGGDGDRGTPVEEGLVLSAEGLAKSFRGADGGTVRALDGVSLAARRGAVTGLLGPDGAGKTTLLRLAAGLLVPHAGTIRVLGHDPAEDPVPLQERAGYMPQRFGLYEDLTVRENLDLWAALLGVAPGERPARYRELLDLTGLGPFTGRLAGALSGGMKQKLGLACTLVRSPELLLLDEPTVGVDPLSRRELWRIIARLVREEDVSVVVSTAYLDEGERCDAVVVLDRGRVLASGRPGDLAERARGRTHAATAPGVPLRRLRRELLRQPGVLDAIPRAGRVRLLVEDLAPPALPGVPGARIEAVAPRLEDAFVLVLGEGRRAASAGSPAGRDGAATGDAARAGGHDGSGGHDGDAVERPDDRGAGAAGGDTVVAVWDLERRFGSFRAVRGISFGVGRGEIFGLLGPNGAGKSTTFRMLCGLLPPSGGSLEVAGVDLRRAPAAARQRVGYVAQGFTLYGQLSVRENLRFFASAYGLSGATRRRRVQDALERFALESFAGAASGLLPHGFQRRLAMACALLHDPEILFLDEPTSGVDPLARREFWTRIHDLADRGVTVIVTTHFLEEAEYCDRIAVLVAGELLALGTPEEIRDTAPREGGREPGMEDAFVSLVEEARARDTAAGGRGPA